MTKYYKLASALVSLAVAAVSAYHAYQDFKGKE